MERWRRLNGEILDNPIVEEVEAAILQQKAEGHQLKICIGTDSQIKGESIEYATVIVFLRKGKGGFMFINNHKTRGNIGIKERMIIEVSRSIDIAYRIADLLDRLDVELEVHADINTDPVFKSNVAFKEAMGYILGMGFTFKAKPHAFASSSCADKIL